MLLFMVSLDDSLCKSQPQLEYLITVTKWLMTKKIKFAF